MAVVLAAMGVFLHARFEEGLRYALEKGIRSRAQAIVTAIERGEDRPAGEGELIETDEAFAQILDADGKIVSSSAGIADQPLVTARQRDLAGEEPVLIESTVRTKEDETPDTPSLLLVISADAGQTVVVGASMEDELEALAEVRGNLVVGGAGALLASAFIGWLIAGFALRPVERLRSEAAAISADDGKDLVVPKTRDELAKLGATLNDMIGRMREAVEKERRFVDDASHELRTPLSVLRAALDVTLRRARTTDEMEAALRSAAEQTERLQTLAEDLLLLARSDRDGLPIRREETDVDAALREAIARHETVAAGQQVALHLDATSPLVATIDPSRLRQAMDNLLTNAVRHTPEDGRVTVTAATNKGSLEISVDDTGTGFVPDFLPHAFDAFTRSDDGRTRDDGGTGLGLAIVKAIADAHGGSVEASNRAEGGARVTLRLPV
jgi:heavy metal sensor kinase